MSQLGDLANFMVLILVIPTGLCLVSGLFILRMVSRASLL